MKKNDRNKIHIGLKNYEIKIPHKYRRYENKTNKS